MEIAVLAWQAAALLLGMAAGWGIGGGVPSWRADYFNEVEQPDLPPSDGDDPAPAGAGLLQSLSAWGDYLRASRSARFAANMLLLALALACASIAWPPLWLNPLHSDPYEFLVVTLCQRWIWYTLGACLLGSIAGGASALLRRAWFS